MWEERIRTSRAQRILHDLNRNSLPCQKPLVVATSQTMAHICTQVIPGWMIIYDELIIVIVIEINKSQVVIFKTPLWDRNEQKQARTKGQRDTSIQTRCIVNTQIFVRRNAITYPKSFSDIRNDIRNAISET